MDQSIYLELEEEIITLLRKKLPPELTYHEPEHTLDVISAAERLAKMEGLDPNDLLLVKTAALFHDTGYLFERRDHEQKSCSIAREYLSANQIPPAEIETICQMIMATKVPQQPANRLEEILCDADLDYLGRDDFNTISEKVFEEFRKFGVVHDREEWKKLQVKFFETHRYFTGSAIQLRRQKKEDNLSAIRSAIQV